MHGYEIVLLLQDVAKLECVSEYLHEYYFLKNEKKKDRKKKDSKNCHWERY